ncbi:MAG: hypothetical protein J6A01_01785, partial [Proteobacteria bacterium]|nr:hypothetical protein [Pseudomonadota bacterium]
MSTDDPKIIEQQIKTHLLNAPDEEGFEYIAQKVDSYLTRRDEMACRDLIICARAFVSLSKDMHFVERFSDLYQCGNDSEIHSLAKLFFTDYAPSRIGIPNVEAQNAQTLISQPLGVQKAMARTSVRNHHEALLYSPWPPVIEILCSNPAIREQDILFMASRRPSQNALLEPILRSPWSSRVEIRFALAANPSLNASHALRCLFSLPPSKLEI